MDAVLPGEELGVVDRRLLPHRVIVDVVVEVVELGLEPLVLGDKAFEWCSRFLRHAQSQQRSVAEVGCGDLGQRLQRVCLAARLQLLRRLVGLDVGQQPVTGSAWYRRLVAEALHELRVLALCAGDQKHPGLLEVGSEPIALSL